MRWPCSIKCLRIASTVLDDIIVSLVRLSFDYNLLVAKKAFSILVSLASTYPDTELGPGCIYMWFDLRPSVIDSPKIKFSNLLQKIEYVLKEILTNGADRKLDLKTRELQRCFFMLLNLDEKPENRLEICLNQNVVQYFLCLLFPDGQRLTYLDWSPVEKLFSKLPSEHVLGNLILLHLLLSEKYYRYLSFPIILELIAVHFLDARRIARHFLCINAGQGRQGTLLEQFNRSVELAGDQEKEEMREILPKVSNFPLELCELLCASFFGNGHCKYDDARFEEKAEKKEREDKSKLEEKSEGISIRAEEIPVMMG